jgi:uncharacterized repeat protein (TIGR03803 family)
MKRWYLGRFALSCALALALLAGCAADVNGSSPIGLSAVRTRSGSAYRVLYNFGSYPPDGEIPEAGLIKLNGVLYGTTINGGSGCYSSGGCGTVFAITTSGTETVLHSFSGAADGALPYAALTKINGTLYGTTAGGASTSGTVYSVTTSGKESVLHRFQGIPDGADPQAALIDVSGSLYGTTTFGGAQQNRGTVFQITTSGQEKLLYRFVFKSQGGHRDGKYPESRLLNVNGTLYGTTRYGGASNYGTVFTITPAGKETVLYSFKAGSDGAWPQGDLINVNGTLYGTTFAGGTSGYGTLYSLTTSGKEAVLYTFGLRPDGELPNGDLVNVNGTLYGTTEKGGVGLGTVFAITTSGQTDWLYSFLGKPGDGASPHAGLVNLNGSLYGTTSSGGATNHGTVFSITTSGTEAVLHNFVSGHRSGAYPDARLIKVRGTLYGTTAKGGSYVQGTVFSLTP